VTAVLVAGLMWTRMTPPPVEEQVKARYVVNCAGLGSDKIAKMVGDDSFYMKPRIGEYILLHKNQGHMAQKILFPCPGKMGKGVLVQRTLWGNLILGPTAVDVREKKSSEPSDATDALSFILTKCRDLVPKFDAGEVIHSFAGARAKTSRGDWIIEECPTMKGFIHAAGIDSPGLAGSPAIAKEVVRLLGVAGLGLTNNADFNPERRPIIVPKNNWKVFRNGKYESIKLDANNKGNINPAHHVVCRCEKVTEAEIVDAIRRRLPVDSTQAIRKRTRAGMGHCQGEYCESRVKAIIARETGRSASEVGTRPWPATSCNPQRWMTDEQKDWLRSLVSSK